MVDVFRASATMCAILHNGATAIIPVADIEEAKRYKSEEFLVGAERDTRKCDFADFGNSPFDYIREKVAGKEIVFTTTNGTRAIEMGSESKKLYVGTFSNIGALAEKCAEKSERVVIICAGWNNRVNIEDMLFGGAFAEKISGISKMLIGSDSLRIALELWKQAKQDPLAYLKESDHYRRLKANGAEGDADYCLRPDTVKIVPYYDSYTKRLKALS